MPSATAAPRWQPICAALVDANRALLELALRRYGAAAGRAVFERGVVELLAVMASGGELG